MNVLIEIMGRLGLSRNFFLEQKLMQAGSAQTLQYYVLEQFLEEEFFKKKTNAGDRDPKTERLLRSLEFLNK